MEKDKTKELLAKMDVYVPVYIIENELKMPKNTLQKAISEKELRGLPKKWDRLLTDFVILKKYLTTEYVKNSSHVPKEILPPVAAEKNKLQVPSNEIQDALEFDIEKYFNSEKYTLHPKSSMPKEQLKIGAWKKEKHDSDWAIKMKWQEFQKKNQS